MYKKTKPMFLTCETPLHAGSGSDLGVVDLPIQRERHTAFPKIESSSLKGALREAVEMNAVRKENDRKAALENLVKINKVFGYDDAALDSRFNKEELDAFFKVEGKEEPQTSFAGAIGFTDARLLLFPVKSMKGVFAWITCPKALKQFESDMQLAFGKDGFQINGLADVHMGDGARILSQKSGILFGQRHVILEEYTYVVDGFLDDQVSIVYQGTSQSLGQWLSANLFPADNGDYWKQKIQTDIALLPDDDFRDYVNLSTEVITRTKISNETGTVESGALFTEEYLPAESILYSLVLVHDEFTLRADPMPANDVLDFFREQLPSVVQIGANATIGKGIVRTGTSFFKT